MIEICIQGMCCPLLYVFKTTEEIRFEEGLQAIR